MMMLVWVFMESQVKSKRFSLDSVQLGSNQSNSARLSSIRIDSVQLGSTRFITSQLSQHELTRSTQSSGSTRFLMPQLSQHELTRSTQSSGSIFRRKDLVKK
ncbi:hypothetical protein HanIR_Chr08g0371131 [Helianthus annuus]|nr:hypothetical protein HanIR_Chr08g0371131 [Helianthus annuus]